MTEFARETTASPPMALNASNDKPLAIIFPPSSLMLFAVPPMLALALLFVIMGVGGPSAAVRRIGPIAVEDERDFRRTDRRPLLPKLLFAAVLAFEETVPIVLGIVVLFRMRRPPRPPPVGDADGDGDAVLLGSEPPPAEEGLKKLGLGEAAATAADKVNDRLCATAASSSADKTFNCASAAARPSANACDPIAAPATLSASAAQPSSAEGGAAERLPFAAMAPSSVRGGGEEEPMAPATSDDATVVSFGGAAAVDMTVWNRSKSATRAINALTVPRKAFM